MLMSFGLCIEYRVGETQELRVEHALTAVDHLSGGTATIHTASLTS